MALKKISESKYVFTTKSRHGIFRTEIYKVKNKSKPYVLLFNDGDKCKSFCTQAEIL